VERKITKENKQFSVLQILESNERQKLKTYDSLILTLDHQGKLSPGRTSG
jgi:hypothetical protein